MLTLFVLRAPNCRNSIPFPRSFAVWRRHVLLALPPFLPSFSTQPKGCCWPNTSTATSRTSEQIRRRAGHYPSVQLTMSAALSSIFEKNFDSGFLLILKMRGIFLHLEMTPLRFLTQNPKELCKDDNTHTWQEYRAFGALCKSINRLGDGRSDALGNQTRLIWLPLSLGELGDGNRSGHAMRYQSISFTMPLA